MIEVLIYVKDMGSQVRFYLDILGLRSTYPLDALDFASEHWVTFDTGACVLALHGGGNGIRGEDAPKFVFGVSDLASARDKLKELRMTCSCDCMQRNSGNNHSELVEAYSSLSIQSEIETSLSKNWWVGSHVEAHIWKRNIGHDRTIVAGIK